MPEAIGPDPADPQRLCTECGLCCNGALFDTVLVGPEEARTMAELGLDLFEQGPGGAFRQPCAMLAGSLCTIYADRPSCCRTFRCSLLGKYVEGKTTLSEARQRIAEARLLIDLVTRFLESGESIAQARTRWKERNAGEAAAHHPRDHAQHFLLQMTALNVFLDKHFRPESQRQVIAVPVTRK
jgi:Fe-S-cluster containining protein